jgi:hypothetical protein
MVVDPVAIAVSSNDDGPHLVDADTNSITMIYDDGLLMAIGAAPANEKDVWLARSTSERGQSTSQR